MCVYSGKMNLLGSADCNGTALVFRPPESSGSCIRSADGTSISEDMCVLDLQRYSSYRVSIKCTPSRSVRQYAISNSG